MTQGKAGAIGVLGVIWERFTFFLESVLDFTFSSSFCVPIHARSLPEQIQYLVFVHLDSISLVVLERSFALQSLLILLGAEEG